MGNDLHSGTGQGNIFLGEYCKIKSEYILKSSENKQLGALIRVQISNKNQYRLTLAFIDDNNMYLNGPEFQQKIQ